MGHYAVDFQCDKCGKLRCVCSSLEDKTLYDWVVDNYQVMQVIDYEKKYKSQSYFSRMIKNHHKTKEAAEVELLKIIQDEIKYLKDRLTTFEKRLNQDQLTTVERSKLYDDKV